MSDKKILIVDDEADLLEMYKELIEEEGFEVKACESGEKAFEALEQNSFDLIISDHNMGEVSGEDLLKHVNQNIPGVPFFLVTGENNMQGLEFAHSMGGLLTKPVDIFALIDRINESLADAA